MEWLGNVPDHWRLVPLKRAAACPVDKADGAEEYPFIALEHIEPERGRPIDGFDWQDRPAAGCAKFLPGDVLFGKLRPYLCKCLLADRAGCCPTELLVLKPAPGLTGSRYLYYLTQGRSFVGLAIATSYGTKMPRTSWEKLGPERVCLPPLDEQRAIAEFLDRETGRIDALIEKKRRLIELLEEKRTALITRAVTKGLDPDVPLKPSGVEWLGDIPEHWEVRRLRFAAKLESGHTPSRSVEEYWEDATIPWVSLNDVGQLNDADYVTVTENKINELGLANSSARMLPAGTVILSRDATVGRAAILGDKMATAQHFVNWICGDDLLPEYLLHLLRVPMQGEFERLGMGATISTIGMPDINTLRVPLPPTDEQRRIVAHICAARGRIDDLIAKVREAITKLREYRTALISAAVTGKIDVRDM